MLSPTMLAVQQQIVKQAFDVLLPMLVWTMHPHDVTDDDVRDDRSDRLSRLMWRPVVSAAAEWHDKQRTNLMKDVRELANTIECMQPTALCAWAVKIKLEVLFDLTVGDRLTEAAGDYIHENRKALKPLFDIATKAIS